MFENEETHESYGKISFGRFTSNGSSFFGTDVSSNGGISIEIATATKNRNLNSDTIFRDKEILRVDMSYNQFYEAIGAMMNSTGVACTIIHREGKSIEQVTHDETKQELFQREFKEDVIEIGSKLDSIETRMNEMVNGKTIKKSEFKELLHDVQMAKQHINSNLPFVLKQFGKSLNKSLSEAKNGFAGFIESKIHSLGLSKMKEDEHLKIDIK